MNPSRLIFASILMGLWILGAGCTTLKSEVVYDALDTVDSGPVEDVVELVPDVAEDIVADDIFSEDIPEELPPQESAAPEVDPAIFEHSPNCGDGIRAAFEYCLEGQGSPEKLPGIRTLSLGDVDKDGRDDLLVTLPEEVRVRVYRSQVGNLLGEVLVDEIMPEDTLAYSATFIDLDEDGALDILASGYSSALFVLKGDGEGAFSAFDPPLFQPHYYYRLWRHFDLMDVNGDGLSDLVGFRDAYKGSSWGYPVLVIRNEDGSFAYPRLVTTARSAVFSDLDLDGDLDVVMEDRKGEFLRVAWQTNSSGTYPVFNVMDEGVLGSSGTPVLWKSATRKPARFIVGARDEILEVGVGHPEGVLSVDLLGTTDLVGTRPWYPQLLDADLDGAQDILVAGTYQNRFALLMTREGQPMGSVALSDAGPSREAMAIGDEDGDGYPDALFWSETEEALRWVSLAPEDLARRSPATLPVEQSAEQSAAGDIDGDGFADVAGVHSEKGIRVLLGDGAGGVKQEFDFDLPGMSPSGVAVGDLDGDGLAEVVAVGTSKMIVVRINGVGAVTMISQLLPYTAHALALANQPDATGDGIADIFVTDMNQKAYLMQGDGEFGFELVWTGIHEGDGAGIRVGDFNNDGYSGCVTFGKYPKTLTRAFLNLGGTLSNDFVPVSVSSRHVEVGDVNGDGFDDIVGGSGGGSAVVAFAKSNGSFRVMERDGDLTDEQTGLAVLDLDGDAVDELVVPDHGDLVVLKANFHALLDYGTPPQEVKRFSKPGYQRRLMSADIDGDGALDLWSIRSGTLLGPILNLP